MKTLFISAGHSHKDPGAKGNGFTEAEIVLEFRDMLAKALLARGVDFAMDGMRGENLPLSQASAMASRHDIALEFHSNAFTSPQATGVETLSRPEDMALGNRICSVVADTLGIRKRGAKGESSGQHSRLAFVSTGGGIIVELFFISNPDDLRKYQARKYDLADALARLLHEVVNA